MSVYLKVSLGSSWFGHATNFTLVFPMTLGECYMYMYVLCIELCRVREGGREGGGEGGRGREGGRPRVGGETVKDLLSS